MIENMRQRLVDLRRGFDSIREAERRSNEPSYDEEAIKAQLQQVRSSKRQSKCLRGGGAILSVQHHTCGLSKGRHMNQRAHCASCNGLISLEHLRYLRSIAVL